MRGVGGWASCFLFLATMAEIPYCAVATSTNTDYETQSIYVVDSSVLIEIGGSSLEESSSVTVYLVVFGLGVADHSDPDWSSGDTFVRHDAIILLYDMCKRELSSSSLKEGYRIFLRAWVEKKDGWLTDSTRDSLTHSIGRKEKGKKRFCPFIRREEGRTKSFHHNGGRDAFYYLL